MDNEQLEDPNQTARLEQITEVMDQSIADNPGPVDPNPDENTKSATREAIDQAKLATAIAVAGTIALASTVRLSLGQSVSSTFRGARQDFGTNRELRRRERQERDRAKQMYGSAELRRMRKEEKAELRKKEDEEYEKAHAERIMMDADLYIEGVRANQIEKKNRQEARTESRKETFSNIKTGTSTRVRALGNGALRRTVYYSHAVPFGTMQSSYQQAKRARKARKQ